MPGNGRWPLVAKVLSATAARKQILPMVSELGRGLPASDELAALTFLGDSLMKP